MVTLDKIRLDMAELQKLDQSVRSVEVHADTLDEALADAAVQLNTKVSNLEYEVKEKGFDGFFGIAKRPWFITVYQNAESVAKSAKFKELQKSGLMDMDEEIENIDRDGEFFLHHFGTDICLKVNLPAIVLMVIVPFLSLFEIEGIGESDSQSRKVGGIYSKGGAVTGGKYLTVPDCPMPIIVVDTCPFLTD